MFFCSVRTRGNFSPARNVLSTTDPDASDFSFVRTNAPPLPGFTCWNSTIRHVCPSSSMCIPLRNWFVEMTSAIASTDQVAWDVQELTGGHELGHRRGSLAAGATHHEGGRGF